MERIFKEQMRSSRLNDLKRSSGKERKHKKKAGKIETIISVNNLMIFTANYYMENWKSRFWKK